MKKGIFITFEGIDGCGKTVQAALLYKYLRKKGYPVILTREPGGTSIAEQLRKVLLSPRIKLSPLAELLFYAATRAQHVIELIQPHIKRGKIVICERFSDATLAYQGYGRKIPLKLINIVNKIATGGLIPDLTILLDLPVRKVKKKKYPDRFEQESIRFHQRVRNGYLQIAKKCTHRVSIIAVEKKPEQTFKKIVSIVTAKFRLDNSSLKED